MRVLALQYGRQQYYKVEAGNGLAEFFMLDSNDFGGSQVAWLENSLSASQAKWRIAIFHHPIYHFMTFEISGTEASFQAISESGRVVDDGMIKQTS